MVHNHIVIFAARILGTATGLLFLYGACFLYPDERKLFQSRAEDWWIELDELRSRAVKGEPAFICWIATTAHKGFYWLFGEPLSSKFFIVSGLLSMTSFAFTMMTFGGYSWAVPTGLLIPTTTC